MKLTLTVANATDAAAIMEALEKLDLATDAVVELGRTDSTVPTARRKPMNVTNDDDAELDAQIAALNGKRNGQSNVATAKPRQTINPRVGARVLYTPAGTQRQVMAALAKLTPGTVRAHVMRDLVKHPGSRNADVRARLAKRDVNPESVDNAIWTMVNAGLLRKEAE